MYFVLTTGIVIWICFNQHTHVLEFSFLNNTPFNGCAKDATIKFSMVTCLSLVPWAVGVLTDQADFPIGIQLGRSAVVDKRFLAPKL